MQDIAGRRLQSMRVAVNISAHTFQQPNLIETITFVLQKTGMGPHFLDLEITENSLPKCNRRMAMPIGELVE